MTRYYSSNTKRQEYKKTFGKFESFINLLSLQQVGLGLMTHY